MAQTGTAHHPSYVITYPQFHRSHPNVVRLALWYCTFHNAHSGYLKTTGIGPLKTRTNRNRFHFAHTQVHQLPAEM